MDPTEYDNIAEIQERLNKSVREESNTEEKIDFIELLRELVRKRDRPIHYDTIRLEGRMMGLADERIDRFLDELERDKIIASTEGGRYAFID